MRSAFIETLCACARRDERICLAVADLGFSVVEPFAREFPDRFLNVGVAEQNLIGVATGWSLAEDRIVFVYSLGNFPVLRCLEQIRNDACHHSANVKIVSVGGGLTYGTAGFSHHAVEDVGVLRTLPGIAIATPADASQTCLATEIAATRSGPFYLRLGRNREFALPECGPFVPGEPIVHRDRGDVALVYLGTVAAEVFAAAEQLQEEGIAVAVIGIPFVRPLRDDVLLEALSGRKGVVTVEEHVAVGGLRSLLAELLVEQHVALPLRSLHVPEGFDAVGSQGFLRREAGLDAGSIAAAVRSMHARRPATGALPRRRKR